MEHAEQAMALVEGFTALEEFRATGSREGFRAWSEKYSDETEVLNAVSKDLIGNAVRVEKEGGCESSRTSCRVGLAAQ